MEDYKGIEIIEEFLENWKQSALKYYINMKAEYKAMTTSNERLRFWEKHTAKDTNMMMEREKFIIEKLDKEVVKKKEAFISKIIKITGNITDCKLRIGPDGSINGIVKGENESVIVETIYAGGYNIQVLHFRVLIKKLRNKVYKSVDKVI